MAKRKTSTKRRTVFYPPADWFVRQAGSYREAAELIGLNKLSVYRWSRPKTENGLAGLIPSRHQAKILKVAREHNLDIEPIDIILGRTVSA